MEELAKILTERTLRAKLRLIAHTQIVLSVCERRGVSVEEVTPHHLRLTKEGYPMLNVFPLRCKVSNQKINYIKVELENFLLNYYES